jgi:hypothetical protein
MQSFFTYIRDNRPEYAKNQARRLGFDDGYNNGSYPRLYTCVNK